MLQVHLKHYFSLLQRALILRVERKVIEDSFLSAFNELRSRYFCNNRWVSPSQQEKAALTQTVPYNNGMCSLRSCVCVILLSIALGGARIPVRKVKEARVLYFTAITLSFLRA